MIRLAGVLAALAMLLMADSHAGAAGAEVLGTRPAHLSGELPAVPNDAAILSRIWAPEIDEGYVPQGVTVADGALLTSYDMVIGVEDISFDAQGRLWTVSEAGSLRWSRWSHAYPVLFSIDPALLR